MKNEKWRKKAASSGSCFSVHFGDQLRVKSEEFIKDNPGNYPL
jgi:hypothetical protein